MPGAGSKMGERTVEIVDVTPEADSFWATQGHHFDSFTQAVNEFIDNSIANFAANADLANPTVVVEINETEDEGAVRLRILDSGTGIQDIGVAFRVGDRSLQDGEPSEHGVGLKHALAYLDSQNSSWTVATRTANDMAAGSWRRVSAPYGFELEVENVQDSDESWPGLAGSAGTVIDVISPYETFRTVARGFPGNSRHFSPLVGHFSEDLAYTYAGLIESGAHFRLMVNGARVNLAALKPMIADYVRHIRDEQAPWNPGLRIDAEFCLIENHPTAKRWYRKSMSASGIQIRINGRVIESNIFGDIWDREKHNSYNTFLGIIDLKPDRGATRPKTVSTKNRFRRDDGEVVELLQWIKNVLPEPPKQIQRSTDENELADHLANILASSNPDYQSANCEREFRVYRQRADVSAPAVDIKYFSGLTTTLIECKLGSPKALDVYQLIMQWDGAVEDNVDVNRAWLVADRFSEGIEAIVESLNTRADANGSPYRIELRKWSEWITDRVFP